MFPVAYADQLGRDHLESLNVDATLVERGVCLLSELDRVVEDDATPGSAPLALAVGGDANDVATVVAASVVLRVSDDDNYLPAVVVEVETVALLDVVRVELERLEFFLYIGGHLDHLLPYR